MGFLIVVIIVVLLCMAGGGGAWYFYKKKKITSCPSNSTYGSTAVGAVATAPCPTGFTGNQTARCNADGTFGTTDTSLCVALTSTPASGTTTTPQATATMQTIAAPQVTATMQTNQVAATTQTSTTPNTTAGAPALFGSPAAVLGAPSMTPWKVTNFKVPTAQWIWNTATAASGAPSGKVQFSQVYNNTSIAPLAASLHIIVDDSALIMLNGVQAGTAVGGYAGPYSQVAMTLQPGWNRVDVIATNSGGPGGLLCALVSASDSTVLLQSDGSWATVAVPTLTGTLASGLGAPSIVPWNATNFIVPTAQWIWNTASAASSAPLGKVQFSQLFNNTSGAPMAAVLHILVDDSAVIKVNNVQVGTASGWTSATKVAMPLAVAWNQIDIIATNNGGPAGLLCVLVGPSGYVLLTSDATWETNVVGG